MSSTPWWLTPASELQAMPTPDPEPPLTTPQGLALIERLNTPGGAAHVLTASEHEYVSAQPAIRDPALVRHLATAVRAFPDSDQYVTGIRLALDYAHGHLRHGPLSGSVPRTILPLCSDLITEMDLAVDTLNGSADVLLPHSRDLLVGVEHTCWWLTCGTDEPPLPLPQ